MITNKSQMRWKIERGWGGVVGVQTQPFHTSYNIMQDMAWWYAGIVHYAIHLPLATTNALYMSHGSLPAKKKGEGMKSQKAGDRLLPQSSYSRGNRVSGSFRGFMARSIIENHPIWTQMYTCTWVSGYGILSIAPGINVTKLPSINYYFVLSMLSDGLISRKFKILLVLLRSCRIESDVLTSPLLLMVALMCYCCIFSIFHDVHTVQVSVCILGYASGFLCRICHR